MISQNIDEHMNYGIVADSICNLIDRLADHDGSSEVEWAYKDFRSIVMKEIDDSIEAFHDDNYEPKEMLTDEVALQVGRKIMRQLYNIVGEIVCKE